jgi:hypothetical protein
LALTAAWLAVSCASKDPDRPTAADTTYSTWKGTITPTGGETIDISYVIRLQERREAGRILLPSPEADGGEQQAEMTDIEWDGTTLGYSWTDPHGAKLSCELVKQTDTLLRGDCLDPDDRAAAQMTMSPPPGRLDRS